MKKRRRIVWLAALILLALAGASMLLSKYGLEVTRLELGFDGLPAGFDGFKIVQLSDLHGSSFGQDNEKLIKKSGRRSPSSSPSPAISWTRAKPDANCPSSRVWFPS